MRIALTVNGERARPTSGAARACSSCCASGSACPGSKNACEQGECGSCSVLLDGELVCACLVLAAQAEGREVVTVEGLADGDARSIRCRQAFVDAGAVQCGFCTPGLVVATRRPARARTRRRRDDEIREALSGNLCRCTGYQKILDAVRLAAAP